MFYVKFSIEKSTLVLQDEVIKWIGFASIDVFLLFPNEVIYFVTTG